MQIGDNLHNLLTACSAHEASMPAPIPEIKGIILVITGQFNPTIFQPMWFSAEKLLTAAEAENARAPILDGESSMDPKVLLLMALLAPVLMLAGGIFVRPKGDTPSTHPEET